eukprot:580437-Prymnesium_polylepis.4
MAAAARAKLAVEALIVLTGAALLGSLGLQVRLPLLLSPVEAQPLAVLLSTLSAYCGEFTGPVATGLLKDVLAPHCRTDDTTDRLDARCASAGEQHGLFLLLLAMSAVMLLDSFVWAVGAWVTTRQAGTAHEAAPHTRPATHRSPHIASSPSEPEHTATTIDVRVLCVCGERVWSQWHGTPNCGRTKCETSQRSRRRPLCRAIRNTILSKCKRSAYREQPLMPAHPCNHGRTPATRPCDVYVPRVAPPDDVPSPPLALVPR